MGLVIKELNPSQNLTQKIYNIKEAWGFLM